MRPDAPARPEQTFPSAFYQSAVNAGRAGVAAWSLQQELSLALYRDQQRTVFVASLEWATAIPEINFAFDQGFAEGIAQLFAGGGGGAMTELRPTGPARSNSTDLEGRAAQLASLTLMLYGRGREAFNDLFEHDRDNILWLVNDLASEVRDMVNGGER